MRCKHGKLKHPVGGRRCRRRGKKARSKRRSRRTSSLLSGVGIGVVLVGAAVLLPQLLA